MQQVANQRNASLHEALHGRDASEESDLCCMQPVLGVTSSSNVMKQNCMETHVALPCHVRPATAAQPCAATLLKQTPAPDRGRFIVRPQRNLGTTAAVAGQHRSQRR